MYVCIASTCLPRIVYVRVIAAECAAVANFTYIYIYVYI